MTGAHPAPSDPAGDPSWLEAAEAGLAHEQAEADAGAAARVHVTAADLAPDALAQRANADAVRPEPAGRLVWVLVGVVAIAVIFGVIAVGVAVTGS